MKIQVLGSGCPTCKKLYELTQEAAKQLNINEKVEYVTDVSKIIEMGIMTSPVLTVDDKPVMVGFLPDIEKIKDLLIKGSTASDVKPTTGDSGCTCGGNC